MWSFYIYFHCLFSLINLDEHWLDCVAYLILEYHQYLLCGIKDLLMLSVAVGYYSVDFFFLAMANSFFRTLVVILLLMV